MQKQRACIPQPGRQISVPSSISHAVIKDFNIVWAQDYIAGRDSLVPFIDFSIYHLLMRPRMHT